MNELIQTYLDRLSRGVCEPADQPMASIILGDAIRRAQETAQTAWEVSRVFANGLEEVRAG